MVNVKVVIGAGFGDEGKGRMIDYFANRIPEKKLVVRFNGGAQAGHNVVLPNGLSHVHSHVGSGYLSNHDTFLSRHFICNPFLFRTEMQELGALEALFAGMVYIDPKCRLTTPFDMTINQLLEDKRGSARHGSVGVGFGETIERITRRGDPLSNWHNYTRQNILTALITIRDGWFRTRLAEIDAKETDCPWAFTTKMLVDFTDATLEMIEHRNVTISDIASVAADGYQEILFEGAQGLRLDMNYGQFPNVTRSNTGLKNVKGLLKEMEQEIYINGVETCYVTRSYATRHGNGPFIESLHPDYLRTEKETNVTNKYQGNFRYGHLDLGLLKHAIEYDLGHYPSCKVSIAATCLDQWVDKLEWKTTSGINIVGTQEQFVRDLTRLGTWHNLYLCDGPTRGSTSCRELSGVNSAVRVSGLHPGGRGFKSLTPHQLQGA